MGLFGGSKSSSTNIYDETAQQLTATDDGIALAVSRGGEVNITDGGATQAALDAVNQASTDAFEFSAGSLESSLAFVGSATDGLFNTVQNQINQSFDYNSNLLEFTAGAIENNTQAIGNAYSQSLESALLFAGDTRDAGLQKIDEALNFVDDKVDDALSFTAGTVTSVLDKSESADVKNFDRVIKFGGAALLAVVAVVLFRGKAA